MSEPVLHLLDGNGKTLVQAEGGIPGVIIGIIFEQIASFLKTFNKMNFQMRHFWHQNWHELLEWNPVGVISINWLKSPTGLATSLTAGWLNNGKSTNCHTPTPPA